jgi:hypothetical protein
LLVSRPPSLVVSVALQLLSLPSPGTENLRVDGCFSQGLIEWATQYLPKNYTPDANFSQLLGVKDFQIPKNMPTLNSLSDDSTNIRKLENGYLASGSGEAVNWTANHIPGQSYPQKVQILLGHIWLKQCLGKC